MNNDNHDNSKDEKSSIITRQRYMSKDRFIRDIYNNCSGSPLSKEIITNITVKNSEEIPENYIKLIETKLDRSYFDRNRTIHNILNKRNIEKININIEKITMHLTDYHTPYYYDSPSSVDTKITTIQYYHILYVIFKNGTIEKLKMRVTKKDSYILVISDDEFKKNFKIKITFMYNDQNIENRSRYRHFLNDNYFKYELFIDKNYLYSLCNSVVPNYFKKLLNISIPCTFDKKRDYSITPTNNKNLKKIQCEKHIRLDLFKHQINNIAWMSELENEKNKYVEYIYKNDLSILDLNSDVFYVNIKKSFLYDSKYIINSDRNKKIKFRGGVLADEVGLGKTLSMIGLILNNPMKRKKKLKIIKKLTDDINNKSLKEKIIPSRATFILCPSRLCEQWFDEINKYTLFDNNEFKKDNKIRKKLKIILLKTIIHVRKCNYKQLCEADIVIASYLIFNNKNYKNHCNKDSGLNFHNIRWYRIIIDECHEILDNIYNSYKSRYSAANKREIYIYKQLLKLKASKKWCCSGTPFSNNYNSFEAILKFLCNIDMKTEDIRSNFKDQFNYIIQKFFRCNTKKSIKDSIHIPIIIEETKFLDQTTIEKNIYQNAVNTKANNTRLMQLCTHMSISQEEIKIFGNCILTLTEMNDKMIEHFNESINKIEKMIDTSTQHSNICDIKINEIDLQILHISENQQIDPTGLQLRNVRQHLQSYKNRKEYYKRRIINLKKEISVIESQKKIFTNENYIDKVTKDPCCVCLDEFDDDTTIAIGPCGHILCGDCMDTIFKNKYSCFCPMCRTPLTKSNIKKSKKSKKKSDSINVNKYGTKMAYLIDYLNKIFKENEKNRVIVFSQWNNMLNLVGNVLNKYNIKHVYCKGNINVVTASIRKFKKDSSYRVIMLSSETCASGNNLTEATHVVLLDTMKIEKSQAKAIEDQAIGRAVRLGQKHRVKVMRIIMKNTIEYEYFLKNNF